MSFGRTHTLLPANIDMIRTMVQHRNGSRVLINDAKRFASFMIHELEKLGVSYNAYTSDGKVKPVKTIINDFSTIFATDLNVCLLESGGIPKNERLKLIQKLAVKINEILGVNIQIKADPLNSDKPRAAHQICRNIIDVSSKVSRVLTSDTEQQIKANEEIITKYKEIKKKLTNIFSKMANDDVLGNRREHSREEMKNISVRNMSVLNALNKVIESRARALFEQVGDYRQNNPELLENARNVFKEINPDLLKLFGKQLEL